MHKLTPTAVFDGNQAGVPTEATPLEADCSRCWSIEAENWLNESINRYCIQCSYVDFFKRELAGDYNSFSCGLRGRLIHVGLALLFMIHGPFSLLAQSISLCIDAILTIIYGSLWILGVDGSAISNNNNGSRAISRLRLLALGLTRIFWFPAQILCMTLGLVFGLFSAQIASWLMLIGITPDAWIIPRKMLLLEKYRNSSMARKTQKYFDRFGELVFNGLQCCGWGIAVGMTTVIVEFRHALNAALLFPLGRAIGKNNKANNNNFTIHGLNPTKITKKQSELPAILLIHGNFHDQTGVLPLAYWLSQVETLKNCPRFSINLPNNAITEKDKELIRRKLSEIVELYNDSCKNKQNDDDGGGELVDSSYASVKLDVVGHSRGALVASMLKFGNFFDVPSNMHVGTVITLGTPVEKCDANNSDFCYDIIAKNDVLCTKKSYLTDDGDRCLTVQGGHLELLFSSIACAFTARSLHKGMAASTRYVE